MDDTIFCPRGGHYHLMEIQQSARLDIFSSYGVIDIMVLNEFGQPVPNVAVRLCGSKEQVGRTSTHGLAHFSIFSPSDRSSCAYQTAGFVNAPSDAWTNLWLPRGRSQHLRLIFQWQGALQP